MNWRLWLRVLGLLPWPQCVLCTMPLTREYWREESSKPFGSLMCLMVHPTGMCVLCAVAEEKRLKAVAHG